MHDAESALSSYPHKVDLSPYIELELSLDVVRQPVAVNRLQIYTIFVLYSIPGYYIGCADNDKRPQTCSEGRFHMIFVKGIPGLRGRTLSLSHRQNRAAPIRRTVHSPGSFSHGSASRHWPGTESFRHVRMRPSVHR